MTRRWVIIASERGKRPADFIHEQPMQPPGFDPFAEGNENKTPPEIASYRKPDSHPNQRGWQVRVVPNKYPALQVEGDLNKKGHGVYDRMRGIGAHEIIVETPKCIPSFTSLPDSHVQKILWMYRERLLDLKRDRRLQYGMIFKNVGRPAGSTLYHTHSQLIATPVVPPTVVEKLKACEAYFKFRDRCLMCDLLAQELDEQARLVVEGGRFVAFAPYASRFPFETWVVSRVHASHFESQDESAMEELAFVLKRALLRIEKGLGHPSYNYVVFTAPFQDGPSAHFHWHMEITPRIAPIAGFEGGTGFYVNPVPPEDAADFLRGLKA